MQKFLDSHKNLAACILLAALCAGSVSPAQAEDVAKGVLIVRGGAANMDVLVALGTSMAWGFSTVVTFFGLDQHVYFEGGAAVITMVLLGKLLEARAKARTSEAIESLMQYQVPVVEIPTDVEISTVLTEDEIPKVIMKEISQKVKKVVSTAGPAFHEKSAKNSKSNAKTSRKDVMQKKYKKPIKRGAKKK